MHPYLFCFPDDGHSCSSSLARNLVNKMKTSSEVFMFLNCSENVLALKADKGVYPLDENCAKGDGQKMVSTSNLMICMVMDLFILHCCPHIMILVVKYIRVLNEEENQDLYVRGVKCAAQSSQRSLLVTVQSEVGLL